MSPQQMQINQEQEDSASSDSDSSYTSEEATDQVRVVQDLKEDDIFAKKCHSHECLMALNAYF